MQPVTITPDHELQPAPQTTVVSTWASREAHPSWPGWKWHALHDPLTGLANRRPVDERLREGVRRAAATDAPLTVLFLDLDRFREINRGWGHCVGDHVLRVVARRLVNETRASDTVARWGGDEFVVVMEDATGRFAWAAAERMRAAVAEPIPIPAPLSCGQAVTLTVSIGVARARDGHPQQLVHRSDLAMSAAKSQGGDRVVVAEPARPWVA
jgi:diguanylate cyclase (GGDEF)-like protein